METNIILSMLQQRRFPLFWRTRIITVAAAILGISAHVSALTFELPQTYPTGYSVFQVTIDDFNGDAIPDFAVVNVGNWPSGKGSVTVYLGYGDGTFFQPQADYIVGVAPMGITTGDLNGDNAPDIIAVNRTPYGSSGSLSILLNKNDSTGTFVYGTTVSSGSQPMHAAVGDLDGDSDLDIAVAVHGNDAVQILLGNGDGTFTQPNPLIPVGDGVNGIQIADVNNDNIMDVVTSNWWAYNCSILIGNGDGTLVEQSDRPKIGRRSWTLEVGDLNNDGNLDIAAPNSLDKTLSVLLGNGDGTFGALPVVDIGPAQSYEVELADIDQNGNLDVITSNGDVKIYYGNGDGTLQTPPQILEDLGLFYHPSPAVADFNSDVALDIVATSYLNKVSVFLQIPTIVLIIDDDSIDNGAPPNFFEGAELNEDIATIGLRTQLPFFAANVGSTLTLHTGEVGDESWFALKTIPESWDAAGPTDLGLFNYLGDPGLPFPHDVGPGLGGPDADGDREALLDKIPDLIPLRAAGLKQLEGKEVVAIVYDSDLSINYDYEGLCGSLKGNNLGAVAFKVISVTQRIDGSSSDLPAVTIEIIDAEEAFLKVPSLYLEAPEPVSSSEPFDVAP